MKRFAILILFSTALQMPIAAQATEGSSTGANLRDWCRQMDNDDTAWGLCVGSIAADFDMIMTYQNAPTVKKVVCMPKGGTRQDALNAVVAYMAAHPEELVYSLGDVVFAALADQYPCR